MVNKNFKLAQITRIALLGALLYISQLVLSFLPNIEIVTLLIILFTKNLGKEGTYASLVYVCLTALTWGFGLWWFTYLIVWPLFSLIVYALRKMDNWIMWAVISGTFGLCFGAVFAIPYIFVSPQYALTYWLSGIPFDITHCIGNLVAALVLGKPLDMAISKAVKHINK